MSITTISLGLLGFTVTKSNFVPKNITKPKEKEDDLSPQIPPSVLLKNIDFWLLVLIVFVLSGCAATVVVNLGSMVLSVGGEQGDQDILVFYFSIGNCSGRILFGYLSDIYAHKLSKVSFLFIASIIMGCTQVNFNLIQVYLLDNINITNFFCSYFFLQLLLMSIIGLFLSLWEYVMVVYIVYFQIY